MQISITSSIYLVAVVQAIFLFSVLLRKKAIRISEKYLVAVLVTLSITLIQYVLIINRLLPTGSAFMNISAISWLSISPLLYLYTRSLVKQNEKWSWQKLLFFPLSLYLLIQIVLSSSGIHFGFFLLFNNANDYTSCWILSYLLNSLYFTFASIRILGKAKLLDKQKQKIKWLSLYFKGFLVVLILSICLLLWSLNASYFIRQFEYILLVFYALFIFSLVIFVLRHSNYFNLLANNQYGHDQKDEQVLSTLSEQLKAYVEIEKPYLNTHLTLKELANAIQVSENQLSQIFTRHLDTNFYHFINQYRLAAFEQILQEQGTEQYTIMALAESAGFASKATFYKVFKAHYEMTPSAYIKQLKLEM